MINPIEGEKNVDNQNIAKKIGLRFCVRPYGTSGNGSGQRQG
jgi:hypothetical protein